MHRVLSLAGVEVSPLNQSKARSHDYASSVSPWRWTIEDFAGGVLCRKLSLTQIVVRTIMVLRLIACRRSALDKLNNLIGKINLSPAAIFLLDSSELEFQVPPS